MTATDTATKCGTYAGAQQHSKHKTPPCADCRRARAEYMRKFRESREQQIKDSLYSSARSRALTRLAHLHPAQYEILMDEELSR